MIWKNWEGLAGPVEKKHYRFKSHSRLAPRRKVRIGKKDLSLNTVKERQCALFETEDGRKGVLNHS